MVPEFTCPLKLTLSPKCGARRARDQTRANESGADFIGPISTNPLPRIGDLHAHVTSIDRVSWDLRSKPGFCMDPQARLSPSGVTRPECVVISHNPVYRPQLNYFAVTAIRPGESPPPQKPTLARANGPLSNSLS